MKNRRPLTPASLLLSLALLTPTVHGAVFTWDAGTNTNWDTTTANWTGSVWGNAAADQAIFGTAGAGTVSLTAAINANALTLNSTGYTLSGGTLTLSGTTPGIAAIADAAISSILAGTAGLNKTGAGTLTLSGANTYTGATLVNAGGLTLNGGSSGNGSLSIGSTTGSRGTVNISGGTSSFNGVLVGTGSGSGGAIVVTGGTFNSTASTGYLTVGSGSSASALGYGSLTISSGTVNTTNSGGIRLGNWGLGVLHQTGGTLNVARFLALGLAGGNTSAGLATFTGGTSSISSSYRVLVGDASNGVAIFNLGTAAGGTHVMTSANSSGFVIGNSGGSNGTVNLNSGTLVLSAPINRPTVSPASTAILNLNGGTLQAGASSVTLINATVSPTVYNGGLTVKSGSGTATISANLTAATGNGIYIAGGNLTVANGGSGYLGAPQVTVTGGSGTGATAIANVSGGVITGVTLTNPGKDYLAGDVLSFAFNSGAPTTAAPTFTYTLTAGDLAANTSGLITKNDSGTLILSGNNTIAGATVNGGNLTLAGTNNWSGTATVNAGTLQIGNGGTSGSLNATISNSGNVSFNRSDDFTLTSTITGSGSTTKLGANTLTLDYSSSDTSKLSDDGSLILSGGRLNLSGGTHTEIVAETTINGIVSITRTSGSATIALGSINVVSGQLDLGGTGIATTTSDNVNGILPGVSILGSQAANDGNGNIVIFSNFTDVLRLGGTIPSGASQNVRIVNGGTSDTITLAAGITDINSLNNTATDGPAIVTIGTGNLLRLGSSGTVGAAIGTGGLTLTTGTLTAGGEIDFPGLLVLANSSTSPTLIDSTIANNGIGSVSLSKNGTGSVTLSGPNSYTGSTLVNTGTLTIQNATALGTTAGGTTISSGATLEIQGGIVVGAEPLSITGTGVGGNGVVRNLSGTNSYAGAINVTGSAQLQSEAGTLTLSGAFASGTGKTITKTGPGTLALTANGPGALPQFITVNQGKLQVGGSSFNTDKIAGAGLITINSGATLETLTSHAFGGDNFTFGEQIVINGGTLTVGGAQYVNAATLNGATINGTSEIRASSANAITVTGTTQSTISSTVNIGQSAGAVANFTVADVTSSPATDLLVSGPITGAAGGVTKAGLGTLTVTGASTYSAPTTISAGILQVGNGGATGNLGSGNVINNAAVVINRDATANLTIGGVISGTGTITQTGVGRTILTGTNTWSGITTISAGTLQIGNGGATGTLGSNGVVNHGALVFNRDATTNLTLSAVISGSGTVTQSGTGTTLLSGANTYTGNTSVNSGTLSLGSAFLADGSTVSIAASGATLDLNFDATDTVDKLSIGGVLQASGTWGSLSSSATHKDARITGTGILNVTTGGGTPFSLWAESLSLPIGQNGKVDNPDGDGINNLGEFAFNGNPLSGVTDGKVSNRIVTLGSDKVLTLTIPVRSSAPAFAGSPSMTTIADGIVYTIEATVDLESFTTTVTEVTGVEATSIQSTLPTLDSGWTYHTFRTSIPVNDASKQFIRAKVSDVP